MAASRNYGNIFPEARGAVEPVLTDCHDWDTPRTYSRDDLEQGADACARGLLARGLKRGDAVAILAANRADYLIAFMGIMRAGLVAVPINHKFPDDRIDFVLEDSAASLVICDAERRDRLPAGLPVVNFDGDGDESFGALLDPGAFETVEPDDGDVAFILYTSGSTGRPKGVPLTHKGHLWAHNHRVQRAGSQDGQRYLVAAPLYHMNALCTTLFAFGAGAPIVLLPEFTTRTYIGAIERFGCTMLTCVPPMLAMCLSVPGLVEGTDVSSVRSIRMGSAPVSASLWTRIAEAFPGATLMNVYGTTEAGPVVFGPKDGKLPSRAYIGWPADGVELRLVGPDGSDVDEGELWQKTPAMMHGYLNLPEKTAEVFSEDGFYKSGDVFHRDPETGAFRFVGRVDDMFNCGGENIYPGEVEAMLMTHPGVETACVVPVPDEIKGEKPIAFVVRQPGGDVSESELIEYALANAPAYQHPRRVYFLDQLPLMGPGKVDRNGLGQQARALWAQAS